MKTWIAKFRISNALDATLVPTTPALARHGESDEVRQFAAAVGQVERRLRSATPARCAPPGLHASVMRAVRAASAKPVRRSTPTVWRWLPAPALALLVCAGLWWASRPAPNPVELRPMALPAAGAALDQSYELTRQAPAAAIAPLSKEMENLQRDLRNAVEFLMASVP
jgi:hypothetical protein